MSDVPGSETGIKISSSFKSSGRSKNLMDNCINYQTLHNDANSSNIGPGSYDCPPTYMGQVLLNPSIRDKSFRMKMIQQDGSHRTRLSPIKPPIPKMIEKKFLQKNPVDSPAERLSEIDNVRNLPPLPSL